MPPLPQESGSTFYELRLVEHREVSAGYLAVSAARDGSGRVSVTASYHEDVLLTLTPQQARDAAAALCAAADEAESR